MKRMIISILAVITIAAAVYGGYYFFIQKKSASLESFFPQDTYLYLQASNPKKFIDRFWNSNFGESLKKIEWEALGTEDNLQAADVRKKFEEFSSQPSVKAIYENFFNKEFAIGIYPGDGSVRLLDLMGKTVLTEDILKSLGGTIILATRVEPEVKVAEFVARTFNLNPDEIKITPLEYNGSKINVITSATTNLSPAYILKDDVLIASLDVKGVQKSLDASKGDSISRNAIYQSTKKAYYPDSFFSAFFNLSASMDHFKTQVQEMIDTQSQKDNTSATEAQAARKNYDTFVKATQGFESLSLSATWEESLHFKFNIQYDPNQLDPIMTSFYSCASKTNNALPLVPEETMVSYWNGCFDADALKDQLNPWQAKAYEANAGFLSQIDYEIGGFIKNIKMSAAFPIPQLSLFVKVKDQKTAQDELEGMPQMKMLPQEEEYLDGVKLSYFKTPMEGVEPSYAFVDNFLIISVNRELIKEIINTKKQRNTSLVKSVPAELQTQFNADGASVFFIDVDNFSKNFLDVLNWGETYLTGLEKQQMAFMAGSEQKLKEISNTIAQTQTEIDALSKQAATLEDEIWKLESQALDTSAKLAEKQKIAQDIEAKGVLLEELKTQQVQAEKTWGTFRAKNEKIERRSVIKEKIAVPFLKALGQVDYSFINSKNEAGLFTSESIWMFQ